jgi:hypothetical protein
MPMLSFFAENAPAALEGNQSPGLNRNDVRAGMKCNSGRVIGVNFRPPTQRAYAGDTLR